MSSQDEEEMEINTGGDTEYNNLIHDSTEDDGDSDDNSRFDGQSSQVILRNGDDQEEQPDEPPKELPNSPAKEESPPNRVALDTSEDDDGQLCPVCFEPWTNSGIHRLVSLKCGHLFGRKCIIRWLQGQGSRCPQGQGSRCPQCNSRTKKSDIRPIYSRCVKTLDTSERDIALASLEQESQLRKQAEMKYAQINLKFNMSLQQIEKLKKELLEKQSLLDDMRFNKVASYIAKQDVQSSGYSFPLIKLLELNRNGGCRVMENCDLHNLIVVSQPSANPLFPGFGLRKISLSEFKPLDFLSIHQKGIRDISFHVYDCLVLTASMDKTVKLTNVLTNSVVQTYSLDSEVWSCTWDRDDTNYFFAGVRTGSVFVYDIRNTEQHVAELPSAVGRSPVASLQYLKRQTNAKHRNCGPIVGQLSNSTFYTKTGPNTYDANPLPLEGSFTSLSCDSETSHLLTSFRPSQKHTNVTHTLCELSFEQNMFACNLIHSIPAGAHQTQLTRSKLFSNFGNFNSVFVCAGDEEAKAAKIWIGGSGELLTTLVTESPVMDLTTIRGQKTILATLTEHNLRFYNCEKR